MPIDIAGQNFRRIEDAPADDYCATKERTFFPVWRTEVTTSDSEELRRLFPPLFAEQCRLLTDWLACQQATVFEQTRDEGGETLLVVQGLMPASYYDFPPELLAECGRTGITIRYTPLGD